MSHKPGIALIGLGFGAEFIPVYQHHPDAELRGICQRNAASMHAVGEQWSVPVEHRYSSYEEVLLNPEIDAVHINSPISDHA